MIDGHEAERRVRASVHELQGEPIPLGYARPEGRPRSAQGVRAETEPCGCHPLHVDDAGELLHIGADIVIESRRGCPDGTLVGDPAHLRVVAGQDRVGPCGDPRGHPGIGRPSLGRVVLDPAVRGGVVRRRDDDAVRQVGLSRPVVFEYGVRYHRGRGEPPGLVCHHVHRVCREHLQGRPEGGFGQAVGILAQEQGAGDGVFPFVVADGLGNGQDVIFVEAPGQ